jgi:hypothetical protein
MFAHRRVQRVVRQRDSFLAAALMIELQKLHGRSVVQYERDPKASRWRIRRNQDVLPVECLV